MLLVHTYKNQSIWCFDTYYAVKSFFLWNIKKTTLLQKNVWLTLSCASRSCLTTTISARSSTLVTEPKRHLAARTTEPLSVRLSVIATWHSFSMEHPATQKHKREHRSPSVVDLFQHEETLPPAQNRLYQDTTAKEHLRCINKTDFCMHRSAWTGSVKRGLACRNALITIYAGRMLFFLMDHFNLCTAALWLSYFQVAVPTGCALLILIASTIAAQNIHQLQA